MDKRISRVFGLTFREEIFMILSPVALLYDTSVWGTDRQTDRRTSW